MQGLPDFVATEDKVRYIQAILEVGFDTVDFGSFVSPKAIPQMRDTAEVLEQLDLSSTKSHLLAIVANLRGAEDACQHEAIAYLGFPLSISETFQLRNTNKTVAQALATVGEIQDLCVAKGKTLVVYISMGFGNPYGESYSESKLIEFVQKLAQMGIRIVSLSDTIGSSHPELLQSVFEKIIPAFPHIEIGAHLHSNPATAYAKIEAAYEAGCRRFDGAIGGMGGCPMAKDELTGNIATEQIIRLLEETESGHRLNLAAFSEVQLLKTEIFG